jgi:hypothetical protein
MNTTIKQLVKKALKDKPKFKPARGYKFLEDINPGTKIITHNKTQKALVLHHTQSSSTVIVYDVTFSEYKDYYLGKHQWGGKTEVKEI